MKKIILILGVLLSGYAVKADLVVLETSKSSLDLEIENLSNYGPTGNDKSDIDMCVQALAIKVGDALSEKMGFSIRTESDIVVSGNNENLIASASLDRGQYSYRLELKATAYYNIDNNMYECYMTSPIQNMAGLSEIGDLFLLEGDKETSVAKILSK